MSIAKKLKQIRYPLLIMWGILLGAAGTAGVKSSGHVLPTWIIWAIVILGVIVMFGWDIPNDHILLIGFDGSTPRDVGMDAVVTGKDHMEYFGKIEMLYCKKRSGVSGTEKLKTEKFVKKTFSREQWEKGTEEISILEVLKE